MNSIKKNILIISHDATRTGAPILLLNLFRAIKEDYNIEFLLKKGGGLEKDFEKSTPTFYASFHSTSRLMNKIKCTFFSSVHRYKISKLNWKQYDIVISNTITNGDLLPLVRKYYKGKIISYIHELEMATDFFTTKENLTQLLKCTDEYFVPSLVVKKHLVKNLHINATIIHYMPYYTPTLTDRIKSKTTTQTFIIGSVGTSDWRKSPDLFVIIANIFFKIRPESNVKFIWKGATKSIELDRLLYDVKQAELYDKVVFVEASNDTESFFESLNLFILTSREDPYPLVVLEAANSCVPTICFDKAGGAKEFIENSKSGFVSAYLDVDSFVDRIVYYYDNRIVLQDDGNRAKQYLKKTHQNKDFVRVKFQEAVNKIIN